MIDLIGEEKLSKGMTKLMAKKRSDSRVIQSNNLIKENKSEEI
jgi:hypothetical protein